MKLTSPAFADGERIPDRFCGIGEDVSPSMSWDELPPYTRSLALTCEDLDAPGGVWHHWAVFDIPHEADTLGLGYPRRPKVGQTRQAVNDFGQPGYGGPMPPPGSGVHRYVFRLFALKLGKLALPADVRVPDVIRAARAHALAECSLTGTHSRD